ncbi:CYFA0S07e04896g1_1 [Cyberlindnera fabianii]|uniref:CYFA0S07e04896g1_1 n=1 Tax=Cyberlindnera fabianii TaxID=36022 RepID=A0A061B3T1_CYBFA|nr:CYFA0S07e04896g1_1 [Cyberlindnera fabianii]
MDEDLYDEFGNLIGDPQDSDAESVDYVFEREDSDGQQSDAEVKDADSRETGQQLIVHEEKRLYPTMSETFGEGVETVVHMSDTQSIAEPLVKPKETKVFKIEDKKLPKTSYTKEYLLNVLEVPSKVRNVSLVGSLNSGKTSFLDMLILETHQLKISKKTRNYKKLRYTDNTKLEIERGVTIKSSPMSLLLQNLKDNSTAFNLIDTPGHVDFADEVAIAQRLTDISVVVVDVVEGLTIGAKRAIDNALMENIELAFIINKIDRLVLELKLPPLDAFHKIRNDIDEINTYLIGNKLYESYQHQCTISPDINNVLFASADFNFCFNLRSFAKLYSERLDVDFDIDAFAKRLWGNIYYDESRNKFTTKGEKRSFIHFILEPIYKIVTQVISQPPEELKKTMYKSFGITLSKDLLKSDPQVLLREMFRLIFGNSRGFVDVIETYSSPEKHSKNDLYTGSSPDIKAAIAKSSSDGPLIAHISKMIDPTVGVGRVFSGTLKKGDHIKVLGENYNDDDEDLQTLTVQELFIPGGRYKIPVEDVPSGAIFLLGGIDSISKTGTIYGSTVPKPLSIFKPVNHLNKSVFKVVIEPQIPTDLPKMLDGLRKINKSYCGVEIKVEESGEHVVFGSGELYLDSLMYDLRNVSDINIKISDPITKFSETVVDSSFTKVTIRSQNEQNSITIIAEPLEEDLARDLETGKLQTSQPRINKTLRDVYGWDSLAARSLWSFGPDSSTPNALLDDTLTDEVDKPMLTQMKDAIVQGFQWAVREGPLTDEPIRGVKFKIIDAKFSKDLMQRGNGQIIPMVRRACYSAMLTSTPKLMEPVYNFEIVSTANMIRVIEALLDKRRGAVLKDSPIAATQLYKIHGFVPVIDCAGLETDIRVATQGQALVSLYFEKWAVVPGDPLDKDVFIPKLKPAPVQGLARDFVMKTRKRKGLSGEPSLAKYIDKELVDQLKELGLLV